MTGCLLQIVNGAKAEGLNLRTAHPVTLLAEAYRREQQTGTLTVR